MVHLEILHLFNADNPAFQSLCIFHNRLNFSQVALSLDHPVLKDIDEKKASDSEIAEQLRHLAERKPRKVGLKQDVLPPSSKVNSGNAIACDGCISPRG